MSGERKTTRRTTLGNYRLVAKFIEEPLWAFFVAEERSGDGKALLKVLAPRLSTSGELFNVYRGSLPLLHRLDEAHILPVIEVGKDRNYTFVAFEFFEGAPLKNILKEHTALDWKRCMSVAAQVTTALRYAHLKGIIHGRLNTNSILIDKRGQVKVSGFGAHRLAGYLVERGSKNDKKWLYPYLSPEQVLSHGEIDGRSDFFSLGVILYEALTGAAPFRDGDPEKLGYEIISTTPEPINQCNADVPDEVARFISRCLAKNPDDRYLNGQQMLQDIAQFVPVPGLKKKTASELRDEADQDDYTKRSLVRTIVTVAARPLRSARAQLKPFATALSAALLLWIAVSAIVAFLLTREETPHFIAATELSSPMTISPEQHRESVLAIARRIREIEVAARAPAPGAAEGTGITSGEQAGDRIQPALSRRAGVDEPPEARIARPSERPQAPPETPGPGNFTFADVQFAEGVRIDGAGAIRQLPARVVLEYGPHLLEYYDADGNVVWRDEKRFTANSDSTFLASPGPEFGNVTIVIDNAREYGYGYVVIDGEEWRSGGTSATPMRTRLPAGRHRIKIVRDGFETVPLDTVVTVHAGGNMNLSFILRPLR